MAVYLNGVEVIEGNYWKVQTIGATETDTVGSGGTISAVSAIPYMILDAITERAYWTVFVDNDWDGVSDIVVEVLVAVGQAETANDLMRCSLKAEYVGEHDALAMPKTQTRSIDHDIQTYSAMGDVHKVIFVLDHDLADNIVQVGDVIGFQFFLDDITTAPVVQVARFISANIKYRTKQAAPIYGNPFPTEG